MTLPRAASPDPRLAELSRQERAALFDRLRRRAGGQESGPLAVPPRPLEPPLSFAQQRLWLIDRMDPGDPAYDVLNASMLQGPLDAAALARALSRMVARHEILRTTFVARDDRPVQVVGEPFAVALPEVDLRGLAAPARREELDRLSVEESLRRFDLERGPLLAVRLVRLAADEHALLVNAHHIVCDGWSMGVLVRETMALYQEETAGAPACLPPPGLQYADFAVWQREWLQGDRLERQLAWWRERLAGVEPLRLPCDRPRPARRSTRGGTLFFTLPAEVGSRVRARAQEDRSTPFVVLLAAFQALLGRLSGQDDLTVGTPVANRGRSELEALVGFFVNTLVLRADLSGAPALAEHLRRTRDAVLGAFEHQDLPFERLVEELAPDRSSTRMPLFQVLFVLQNAAPAANGTHGLAITPLAVRLETAKVDLTLSLAELSGGGLAGSFEYGAELFEPPTLERWRHGFERLLSAALARPETRLAELPLLSAAEEHQLFVAWNDTARPVPAETLPALFRAAAGARPDAPALLFPGGAVSYGELDRRSERLARRLAALGVGPEVPVGLHAERSVEAVAGILGILKAGGCYVPLDPGLPAARREWMLAERGIHLVVGPDLDLDGPSAEPIAPRPDNLAYAMYTSGSTGTPKPVGVTHANVVRLVRETDYASFASDEVFVQLSPLAFDASTFEIWGALLNGGCLAIPPPGLLSLDGLVEALAEHRVTAMFVTTALFHQLVEHRLAGLAPLRRLLTGGEVLSPERVAQCGRGLPGTALVPCYGPTEATTFTTCASSGSLFAPSGTVTLGRPIANARTYVLDRRGEPVPLGVVGELCLGGDGLARGYLGRPELTAERFVPDPFAAVLGDRLYRTGDLVRHLADGRLEFFGRNDSQVKIRGFRVEPGETEAALVRCSGVRQAAVLVQQRGGEATLVACVVTDREDGAAGLREELSRLLPEPAVPAEIVAVGELPLNRNGKVDKKRLAELAAAARPAAPSDRTVAPRTLLEERLLETAVEVLASRLGSPRQVGMNDNFFELGGHSLLATQLVTRMRDRWGVEVPLAAVFDAADLGELARSLKTREAGDAIARRPEGAGPAPLSWAQQRLWFLDRLSPGDPQYNVPVALAVDGPLDSGALLSALDAVVARHDVLRTRIAAASGNPVQLVAPPGPAAAAVVDLSRLPGDLAPRESERICLAEALRPFDLATGPVLRALLLRRGPDRHVLMVNVHHIATDGWSMGLLVRDVAAGYSGEALPPLPLQYADFAVWERSGRGEERLAAQLATLKRRLAGLPEVLELPTDFPRPAVRSSRGLHRPLALSRAAHAGLAALAREEGTTLFVVLLALWSALLGRYSGSEDVAVGTPVANRNREELQDLVGFFVNTLVLRCDLSGEPSLRDLVRRLRRMFLEALEHQEVPFERLVEELAPRRDPSYTPLFQAMLALQSAPVPAVAKGPLTYSALAVEPGTAKFDLTLSFDATDGLAGLLEASTDLFTAATVDRLGEHLVSLAAGVLADPEAPLASLCLSSPAEREQLAAWSRSPWTAAPPASLLDLWRARAAAQPEALAVLDGGTALTYRELDLAANRLAHRLRRLGIGPEGLVGVLLPRSAGLCLAALAVLKAGGVFLPLDPAHPDERLAGILEDSGAKVVVTVEALAGRLGIVRAAVCLDRTDPSDRTDRSDEPAADASEDNLVYAVYTSGSTGKPKGVGVTRGALARLIAWEILVDLAAPGDRMALTSGPAFDGSAGEIWLNLLGGATTVVPPEEVRLAPARLAVWMAEQRLDRTFLPTPLAEAFLADPGSRTVRLKTILTAGDRLHRLPSGIPFEVANLYGPTEATILVTARRNAERQPGPRDPSIGRPIPGARLYVLDRHGGPAPQGVPGELAIGGTSLARGYLGRPDLTAERFRPDPWGDPGSRLYLTGDRARFLPDADLEVLGRLDAQVKIRGVRIELGEIESKLAGLAGVRQAAVSLRSGVGGTGNRLVAFVVAEPGVEPAGLRQALRRLVPEAMVPSAIVAVPALPLTPNGKLDRRAVAAWEVPLPEAGGGEPRTPLEERLVTLAAELLGLPRVDVGASFFDLGGHSLLAAQLVATLSERWGIAIELADLFETASFAELADRITERELLALDEATMERMLDGLAAEGLG